MHLSMNIGTCAGTCYLVLFIDILSTSMSLATGGVLEKARLCVQYEINDHNSSALRCDAFSSVSKIACFMECVRHQTCFCSAFQFHSQHGFCEILGNEECMAKNKFRGVTFVGVSECKSTPLWQSTEPANGKWRWVIDPPGRQGAVEIASPLGRKRYVGRALHQGLFLPGYIMSPRLTLSTGRPSGGKLQCTSNIQFLIFENSSHYSWKNFYVGDPIPFTAIVGGYWTDGAPLYIVQTTQHPYGTLRSQSYNAKSLQIYPDDIQGIEPKMKILISV